MQDLKFPFVMTIFFLLLGPIKIIQPFARLTSTAEPRFKRDLALMATLCAAVICAAVFLLTENFVANYHLSVPALQIAGGLILLISALNLIFPPLQSRAAPGGGGTPFQLALSPLATPFIVTPAGVAAIMVFVLLAQQYAGAHQTIILALALVMMLNFIVMFFNDPIVRLPGLMPVLQLLGAVLVVVQVALAIQVMLYAFTNLGLISKP